MYWRLPESLLFLSQQGAHETLRQLLHRLAPSIDPGRDLHLAMPAQVRGRGSLMKLFRDGPRGDDHAALASQLCQSAELFFLANWLPLLSTRMGYSSSTAVLMGTTPNSAA